MSMPLLLAALLPVIPQPSEWTPAEGSCNLASAKVTRKIVSDSSLGEEGYRMRIRSGAVEITAGGEQGMVWGRQTLAQLKAAGAKAQCGEIVDKPKYRVRGFMMDVGRMYHSMDFMRDLARTMSYYKMNVLHVHLNDCEIEKNPNADWSKKYSAFRMESKTYPGLTAKDGHYTKKEFREFMLYCKKLGITVIPEFDVPAHALAFTHFKPEFASKIYGADHFDLDKRDEIIEWLKPLFAEYLTGPNPTFIGPYMHVGTDEYNPKDAEKFRDFTDKMFKMVRGFGYKPCAWGALSHARGQTPVLADRDITIDIWHNPFYQPQEALDAGYTIVSIPDGTVYIVPYAGYYFDYLNCENLYNNWEPRKIGNYWVPDDKLDQLAGGKFALWNDLLGRKGNGADKPPYTEADNWDRIYPALQTLSQKFWCGKRDDQPWAEFAPLANSRPEPKGVKFARKSRLREPPRPPKPPKQAKAAKQNKPADRAKPAETNPNAVALSGVVEGYYGRPWGTEGRLSLIKFMGEHGMNFFIYGPKDDPYHHSKWREPYPEKDVKDFKRLLAAAKANNVNFCWAIHLGGGFRKNNDDDYASLFRKLGMMYDTGFRSFAVFFDDFGSADAEFHAEICNRVVKEFLDVKGDCTPLVMCPNVYWGHGNPYQRTLGDKLDKRVHIMWTGWGICSDIRADAVERITQDFKRPPFIWWNWPVNDYCRSKVLLGRTYGLDKIRCSGFVSNPMENCEASKIALYGIAKWCQDPEKFDSHKTWEETFPALYKDPAVAKAMRIFAEHNSDQSKNWHGYRREESVECAPLIARATEQFKEKGKINPVERKALRALFNEVGQACQILLKKLPRDRYTVGWELEGWIEAQKYQMLVGLKALDLVECGNNYGKPFATAAAAILKHRAAAEEAVARHRRKWAEAIGSKNPDGMTRPAVATRELQPFIDLLLQTKLAAAYKAKTGREFNAQSGFESFTKVKALKQPDVKLDGKFAGINRIMEPFTVEPGEWFGLRVPEKWKTDYFHAKLGDNEAVRAGVIELSKDGKNWSKLDTKNNGENMEHQLNPGDGWKWARYRNTSGSPVSVKINQFKFDIRPIASPLDQMLNAVAK